MADVVIPYLATLRFALPSVATRTIVNFVEIAFPTFSRLPVAFHARHNSSKLDSASFPTFGFPTFGRLPVAFRLPVVFHVQDYKQTSTPLTYSKF